VRGQHALVSAALALLGALTTTSVAARPARGAEPTLPATVAFEPPEAWPGPVRAAVASTLGRLPRAIRARTPTAIIRDAIACDAEGWPEDAVLVDSAGRLHLCPAASNASPETLARQVAVGWLFSFDRAAGWSADPGWQRLNGWHASIAAAWALRPENDDPDGFAGRRGQRSPAWDLVTFMAAWLLDPIGTDGGIGCRLISQARFVEARLGNEAPAARRCEPFEAWADLDRLDAVEVVLAAPSTAMIGSLFGHLFVRLAYRDDDGRAPLHLSRTVAFLADNDVPFDADPTYALKGIAGRYHASLHQRSFLDSYREYVVVEGRDLRRWRLNLTAPERRALLERIWTVAHGARYAYYFFRRNCATLMVDLVDSVLPPARDPGITGWLAAPPASTLEPWQRERGADGRPLLEFVADPILSFDHQARLTSRHRLLLEADFGAGLPEGEAMLLADALRAAHDSHPEVRASAYERLAALLADSRVGTAANIHAWLRDAGAVESYLSTLANEQAESREEKARRTRVRAAVDHLAESLDQDASALATNEGTRERGLRLAEAVHEMSDGDPASRLSGYRTLADLVASTATAELAARTRRFALLVSEQRYDVERMKQVPGLRDALLFVDPAKPIDEQPYLTGFEDLIRPPVETRIAPPLRALQRTKERLFAARDLEGSAVLSGPDQDATTVRRAYDASLSRSGIDQLGALGGVMMSDGATPKVGVIFDGALYDERLGDHRHFGFPSDTALVVGRSSALLTVAGGKPVVARYDARVFGYRSLRLPLPEAGGSPWPVGWETYVDLSGSRARELSAEAKIGWGLLVELVERSDLRDHVLFGAGLAYEGYFPAATASMPGMPQTLAAPVSLELRWGLGAEPRYRSWIGARAWAEPIVPFAGAPIGVRSEVGAALDLHAALPGHLRAHDPALLLRGEIRRSGFTFTGAAATEALVAFGVELR
jgi:uncharacterized protein DUF4105